MFWVLLCVILIIICIMSPRWKKKKYMKLYEKYKIDGVMWFPIIGNAHVFWRANSESQMSALKSLSEQSYNKGGMVAIWMGSKLYLGVTDIVIADIILKKCLEKDDVMKFSRGIIGNGSIFAPVNIWRPRRKILAPTFSPNNLNQFVEIFAKQSETMVKRLDNAKEEIFSIWNYLTTYSMDAVCETTLGIKVEAQKQPDLNPFLRAFEEVTRLGAERMFKPWLYSNTIYKFLPDYKKIISSRNILREFVAEIITSREKSKDQSDIDDYKKGAKDGIKTFLDLLIDSSKGDQRFGNLELQEETLVLVMAGTDTSAVAASFTALMLARRPRVQDTCYQELQEVFGESDRAVVPEDLPRLIYLDAVIRETLRLYPPVPIIMRQVEEDLILPSGDTLPKGCGIVISIFGLHRNPSYWGADADQFRPERFLHSEMKHPAAFMPFSTGPRSCLGYKYAMLSLKTALASLLRRHRLLPARSCELNDPGLKLQFDIMMRHRDNYQVKIQRRERKKMT